jgi:exosome complex RNA-binding protein Csl4
MLKFLASSMALALLVLSVGLSEAVDLTKRSKESLSPGVSSQPPTMRDARQPQVGVAHVVRGQVTDLTRDRETIEIQTTEGKKRSYTIDPQVDQNELQNIEPGDNVTVEVVNRDGANVVTSVQKQG